MQKILVLLALLAVAYAAMRLIGNAARLKQARTDKVDRNRTAATQLRYDEKSGAYVPKDD